MRYLASDPPPPFAQRRRFQRSFPPRVWRTQRSLPRVQRVALRGRNVDARTRLLSTFERRLPDILLALLFFAVSLAMNLDALPSTPTHPDESRWLNRAYFARDIVEPFGPTWQEYVTTRGQPPLGSIVMGIGLLAQGKPVDTVRVWDFAYGRDWNERTGAVPQDDILNAGRRTNAVIGGMVAAAAYVLGRLLTNRVGGSIAAIFVAIHPLHIILSTQALSDQTLALLLLLIFISGWAFAKKPTWTRAILLGILLGLGGSVKLTPLLLSVPLAGFGILRMLLERTPQAREYGIKLLWQPVIAFLAFIASYPYLWPSPIRRTWDLYAFRAGEMADQGEAWPETAVASPLDALGRFGDALTETYSSSRWLIKVTYHRLGIDAIPTGYDFIPVAAGVVILLWWTFRRGFWTPASMVAMLMLAEAAILVVGMRTDFYRYHLPIMAIMAGCIAVSTGTAWTAIRKAWRSRGEHPASRRSPAFAPVHQRHGNVKPAAVPAYTATRSREAPQ